MRYMEGWILRRNRKFLKPSCNVPPVETPTYEQGQDEISEMKQGTSEPPVPDTGRSKSSFNTGTTRIKGRTNQRPEPPKVHEQGREPQVEANVPEPPLKIDHQGREPPVEANVPEPPLKITIKGGNLQLKTI